MDRRILYSTSVSFDQRDGGTLWVALYELQRRGFWKANDEVRGILGFILVPFLVTEHWLALWSCAAPSTLGKLLCVAVDGGLLLLVG